MASPRQGVLYFRSRLPADLKTVVAGRSMAVDVGGDGITVKLADTVKISLRTKDEGEARLRHASVQAPGSSDGQQQEAERPRYRTGSF